MLAGKDKGVELVIIQEATMGAWFKSNQPAPTVSLAQCGISSDGECTSNKYGSYKLDPTKIYYLVLHNTAPSSQAAMVYLNIRDTGKLPLAIL